MIFSIHSNCYFSILIWDLSGLSKFCTKKLLTCSFYCQLSRLDKKYCTCEEKTSKDISLFKLFYIIVYRSLRLKLFSYFFFKLSTKSTFFLPSPRLQYINTSNLNFCFIQSICIIKFFSTPLKNSSNSSNKVSA